MKDIHQAIRDGAWRVRHAANDYYFHLAGIGPALFENALPLTPDRLIVIDDYFPRLTSGFRLAEFNAILNGFGNAVVYSTNRERRSFARYAAAYPQFASRVRRFNPLRNLRGSAAYLVFLENAFRHVQTLENADIPFIFELYPGGGFRLNESASDMRLRRITESPVFRKVIVTQSITRDYLLQKGFCRGEQIEFVYGAVVPSDLLWPTPDVRRRYGIDKTSADICFAAFKYMEHGSDKGYDRFIACARILSERYPAARFHVVGNFGQDDIDLGDLRGRITFYGTQPLPFFPQFYSRMDLIISPNRPFVLAPGAFDGFPTASCMEAALCGTAMFVTDELGLNENRLRHGQDCVIISSEPEQIAAAVGEYIKDPVRLAHLGENGQRAVRKQLAMDVQMAPRLRLLQDLVSSGWETRSPSYAETKNSATRHP